MSGLCDSLDTWLDGTLAPADAAAMEAHVAGCSACTARVAHWRTLQQNVAAFAQVHEASLPLVTEAKAQALVAKARARRTPMRWLVPVVVTLSAAALLLVWRSTEPTVAPTPLALVATARTATDTRTLTAAELLAHPLESEREPVRVSLGGDTVALGAQSSVAFTGLSGSGTRLRLLRGAATFSVAKRQPGQSFEIEAGDTRVTVVGTRFSVELGPAGTRVIVTEGLVRVTSADGTHLVPAGQQLLGAQQTPIDEATRVEVTQALEGPLELDAGTVDEGRADAATVLEPTLTDAVADAGLRDEGLDAGVTRDATPLKASSAQLSGWRKRIVAGQLAEVDAQLSRHVARAPADLEALSLLADCRRKSANWRGAVDAYRLLVARADQPTANRSRLLAATILQEQLDDHAAAVELLRQYVAQGKTLKPLEAAAYVRMARSYVSLGRPADAKQALTLVLEQYPNTPAALEAKQLLEKQ